MNREVLGEVLWSFPGDSWSHAGLLDQNHMHEHRLGTWEQLQRACAKCHRQTLTFAAPRDKKVKVELRELKLKSPFSVSSRWQVDIMDTGPDS